MFGISTPYSHSRESQFCDKCLKKWYLSDFSQSPAQFRRASLGSGNGQPVSAPSRITHARSSPEGELPDARRQNPYRVYNWRRDARFRAARTKLRQ
jgi:hypothetical protein